MALLSKHRQNEIDKVIAGVYLATNKAYPDYPLTEIVEQYGVSIGLFDFGDDDNIMGAIKYPDDKHKTPLILINKNKPPENKTFTLAHEFGHYLLHTHDSTQFRLDFEKLRGEGSEYKIEETEANYFAGSMLMPKKILSTLLNEVLENPDLNAIAKYFGVSRKALDVRLAWLRQNQ